VQKVNE